MKKWIIILGVLVGLIILLLIQSDGRKMMQTKRASLSNNGSNPTPSIELILLEVAP